VTLLFWLSFINLLDSVSSSLSSKKCSLDAPCSDFLSGFDTIAGGALLAPTSF
jgi:hypothetical protein